MVKTALVIFIAAAMFSPAIMIPGWAAAIFHIVAFFALSWAVGVKTAIFAAVLSEPIQALVGRSPEIGDLVCNLFGIFLYLLKFE